MNAGLGIKYALSNSSKVHLTCGSPFNCVTAVNTDVFKKS